MVCDENDGYKCHPSKVCNFFTFAIFLWSAFSIFLQKCSSNVKGNSAPTLRDYNYDDDEVDLVPKRGEDENEYCPIGETCCIPEIPKCEDFEGYACTSENVSLSLWIHEKTSFFLMYVYLVIFIYRNVAKKTTTNITQMIIT